MSVTTRYRYADGTVTEVVSMVEHGVVKVAISHSAIGTVGVPATRQGGESPFDHVPRAGVGVQSVPGTGSPGDESQAHRQTSAPPADPSPPQPEQASVETPLAASLLMGSAIPASTTPVVKKKAVGANIAAFIRGTWTFLIAIFVEGGTYIINNVTSLNIPQGYAVIGGGLLQGAIYAAKKRAFPDTVL